MGTLTCATNRILVRWKRNDLKMDSKSAVLTVFYTLKSKEKVFTKTWQTLNGHKCLLMFNEKIAISFVFSYDFECVNCQQKLSNLSSCWSCCIGLYSCLKKSSFLCIFPSLRWFWIKVQLPPDWGPSTSRGVQAFQQALPQQEQQGYVFTSVTETKLWHLSTQVIFFCLGCLDALCHLITAHCCQTSLVYLPGLKKQKTKWCKGRTEKEQGEEGINIVYVCCLSVQTLCWNMV